MNLFILSVFVVLFSTEILKNILGKTRSTPNIIVQALSWVVGVFLMVACQLLDVEALQNCSFLTALVYGVFAAFCANGIASTKIMQTIFLLFKKKH